MWLWKFWIKEFKIVLVTSFILLLAIYQLFQRFISTPLKWINKYKNRLTFAYYSLTLWDFKSLKSAPKTLQTLRAKNKLFKKMSTYRNTAFYDFKSRFLIFFFPVITGTVWCGKYRFLTIFFSKSWNTVLKIFFSRPPANTTHPLS